MLLEVFLSNATAYYVKHKPNLRKGQAYINYYAKFEPKKQIPESVDCFYNDELVPEFLYWLTENWNEQAEYSEQS